jgi:phosphoribosylpyrophosphate synthetase/biotin operon repressor
MRDTKKQIIDFIEKNNQVSAHKISMNLGLSRQMIHRHLSDLIEKNIIYKVGKAPKVFYLLQKDSNRVDVDQIDIDDKLKTVINDNFLRITPEGQRKTGFDGFVYWCNKQDLPIKKTAKEYIETLEKYNSFKFKGLINGLPKIKNTFENVFLDQLFYLDFYSIESFGKTKLGQLLLYSKQSQNKKLIKELSLEIKAKIEKIIKDNNVDSIAFIPPTVKREIQLIKELERFLDLKINKVDLIKIKSDIMVPQKILNKLEDRVQNAKGTISVSDSIKYNKILLIDDAVGSGATLNETAKKIKDIKIAKKVIGLAITGSFKGFDVISEV